MSNERKMVHLEDVCEYIRNGANIKQSDNAEGIPITRIETLSNDKFNRDRLGYADIFDDKFSKYYLNNHDILMSHINSEKYLGRAVLYVKASEDETIIHGMNLLSLRVHKDKIYAPFLAYYFATINFKLQIAKISKKSVNQASFSVSGLNKVNIPLPSIEKQQEIAAVLDKASELVEKRKAQLAELDTLAESIFYDMFGDPITNEKGWETDFLKRLTTKIGSGATPKGGNESYKDEGISLIRSLNIHNGVFKYKDLAHIDDTQAAALNNVTIENNDILLNITGASVARCCIVPNEILPARVNQHVAIVRVIKERVDYRFLCSQLISVQYQRKLLNVGKSNGATREALTKANVEGLKVILPPLLLQQQFAERIEKIEEQKKKVKAALKESEDLFQRLMQDMFNPEL